MAVLVPEIGQSRAYPGRKVIRLYDGGEQVGLESFEDRKIRITLSVFGRVPRPKDLVRLIRPADGGPPYIEITIPD